MSAQQTPPSPDPRLWCELLTDLGALQRHNATIRSLGGGLTNINFRVDVGGQPYVFRISDNAASRRLCIDRESELACARAAAEAGVGPEVVYNSDDRRVLVTRFIQGRQVTEDEVRQPACLAHVARAMRTYHDYHPTTDPASFSPFKVIADYLSGARGKALPMPADVGTAERWLDNVQTRTPSEQFSLCHNDLLAANFIDEDDALRVIDWEYAGWGDPFFDLGNFAANSQLDEDQEQALLKGYLRKSPNEEEIRRLREMRRVSDLREAAWSFLQAAIRPAGEWPTNYLERGRKYLGRWRAAAKGADS